MHKIKETKTKTKAIAEDTNMKEMIKTWKKHIMHKIEVTKKKKNTIITIKYYNKRYCGNNLTARTQNLYSRTKLEN